ncbi:(2Fe-2S) ferredoxin domain-containing protein [Paludifilum halophilum]|uniref:Cobalamin biosynthesis protein CobW n=1 Tax=Paludifilum halophilum TaxID=1642702 RepID=A0A235B949_9BACL|nr:(2Fe-2S) ferredoxin domain-containing protein [Paludifilum halophilum]OYD08814.1 cobalamin biosynthesis protein CobW [Paludifilum halophilum]
MGTWDLNGTRHHVLICNGGSCMRKQAEEVTRAIRGEIAAFGADPWIHTTRTRCNGRCEDGCVVIVYPDGVWYRGVTPDSGRQIVMDDLVGGKPPSCGVSYRYGREGLISVSDAPKGVPKK